MEPINFQDTICAISTAPGVGGIAVIRVSGPETFQKLPQIFKGKDLQALAPSTATYGTIIDPATQELLDQAVVTKYKAPHSFTGEDTAEISVHGSSYIQSRLIQILTELGFRTAAPGEFTQRAFKNGKLDLAEAEAVADIIASSSKAAHRLASIQLQGRFSAHIDALRQDLVELCALVELELDFSEEDVQFADRRKLLDIALRVNQAIEQMTATFTTGSAIKNGIPIAIIGRPNAGKSQLLNTLLGQDRAIVSNIPGTTRDTVEDTIDLQGITFRFIDTAGLRQTQDPIEKLGIERTHAKISQAHIILNLISPDDIPTEQEIAEITRQKHPQATVITLYTKSDLKPGPTIYPEISAKSGQGIAELKEEILRLTRQGIPADESMIVTNARHYQALQKAQQALRPALEALQTGPDVAPFLTTDLLAQHLRETTAALAEITGSITTPDLLTHIFSHFCIGK